jgi:acyl-CoA synthetase (NDP forming)/GNAT superfamily N-acetyltransferase
MTETADPDATTAEVRAVPGAPYPAHWEADVVASDGATAHLRPISVDDADDVVAFHARLSDRTRYFRYFSPYPRIPERDLKNFVEVDHHDRVAFVLWLGREIIAIGRYVRLAQTGAAEVAFVVRDDHQGRGLGSILLEHLAAAARECGLTRFVAEVLTENHQMVRVFRDAGYEVSRALEGSTLHLEFDVASTSKSREVQRAREQRSEARSVAGVLAPRSVAVVGASPDENKIGHVVLANLLRGEFTGPVYPVHPEARSVRGVRAYPTVTDIPDDVDLAVLAVPPDEVPGVFDACLAKGVRGLVVITSGFGETGPTGLAAQRELVATARANGMRVVGPSALGVVNRSAEVSLNASLAPTLPPRGRVGFFSQSGALGIQILATAAERRLGLSTFVSAGNRADLSGNDLLQYWDTDPDTDVVLLYLESFGNPRKFARLARRLARRKPVVAVKTGRHVGAAPGLAAGAQPIDDAAVAAVFDQSGVIRVGSVDELFDVGQLLAHQPLPPGPRVGIVGNSTALGILAADVVLAQGLFLARDPVDLGTSAGADVLHAAVADLLADDQCDALVVVFVPAITTDPTDHARALAAAVRGAEKPVVSTFLASEGVPEGADVEAARALVAEIAPSPRTLLTDEQADALLRCVGVVVAPFRRVRSAEDANAVARELGGAVVLKTADRRWRHRSDLRGVHVGLTEPQAIATAYDQLVELSGSEEVYVQVQAPPGIPCVVEVRDDPSFGSLVSFGLAGVVSELLGDRAYRSTPLSTMDAATLVRAPRAAPLLDGYRGARRADLPALEDLVLRIGVLADAVPEIRSLVLDPVLAAERGAHPTGVTVVLGPPPGPRDGGPRRLR